MLEYSFGIPLDQRIEVVHPADVATAIANSPEADTAGKILFLGGGKSCQMTNRHFQTRLFEALGIGMVCEKAFRVPKDENDYWYTDFMDTEESQRLLKFQKHSFDHYLDDLKRAFGWKRYFTVTDSYSMQKSLERKGRNTPIQGTCGDILKKALSYLFDSLQRYDAKIINLIHDEIVLECKEIDVERVKEIVRNDMIKAGKVFLKSVPVEVEIIIDKTWRK